ncbi:MAG TPA: DUF5069 domain-containing protein [Bacteroidia bacterium]|nr:DUF5069 domain-containing protein [Bacteroidia bacterium]
MSTKPQSPYEQTGGIIWFPRMLDKIRLHAKGDLHADFHANLGIPMSMDGFCCRYLHIDYSDLKSRVSAGGTDEEILEWCFEQGRRLNPIEQMVWNEFVRKFGWEDIATPLLDKLKSESGLTDRNDIRTLGEYMEVDEGRKA